MAVERLAPLATLTLVLRLAQVAASATMEQDRFAAFKQAGWTESTAADPEDRMIVILALKQNNLDVLEAWARRVSDPVEQHYGRFFSRDEVNLIASPSDEHARIVSEFLQPLPGSVQFSKGNDFVRLVCSVSCIETAFGTKLIRQKGPLVPGNSPIKAGAPIQIPQRVADVLEGVSLNAPVFMPSRPKPPAAKPYQYPSSGRTAPRLDPFLGVGDAFLAVRFTAYCKDGSPNNDSLEQGLCSSSPSKVTIVSFDVLILQDPDRQHMVALPAVAPVLGQRPGNCGQGVNCVELNCTAGLENYASTKVVIRAHFSDGSVSKFSAAEEVHSVFPLPYTTPHLLASFYGMLLNKPVGHPRNIISVAEFLGQYYNPTDLETFFQLTGVQSFGPQALPKLIGRDVPLAGSVLGGEAQLDIQYIMALASNVTTWFWSVPGIELSTAQEPFLDWLMQVADHDDDNMPLVHSVSYADDEQSMPAWFKRRVNTEFMKLALRGVSVLIAAGDDGVSGEWKPLKEGGSESCRAAAPMFPASSPWVTAVGGTQLAKIAAPICGYSSGKVLVQCHDEAEVVCSAATGGGITTGGGFSSDFGAPWYQEHMVQAYLTQTDSPVPPSDGMWRYNRSGRGYPDVAAIANNYLVWMGGDLQAMSGTSASTPLVGAMVAHWNEHRLQKGLPPLGFLNPLLYRLAAKHPETFKDVLMGDNKCSRSQCCETGFGAARGWDAVSGLGSPRFDELEGILRGLGGGEQGPMLLGNGLPLNLASVGEQAMPPPKTLPKAASLQRPPQFPQLLALAFVPLLIGMLGCGFLGRFYRGSWRHAPQMLKANLLVR